MIFNKIGDCLISKTLGTKVSREARAGLKQCLKIKIPQRATTYDVVEIGHNYKPEEFSTRIFTFRDKNGKIVQRNIIKKTPEEATTIQRSYKKMDDTAVIDPKDPEGWDCIDVTGRKITTIKKTNGEFDSFTEELQTMAKPEDGPVLNISKIKLNYFGEGLNTETQTMFQYTKDGKKGYIIGDYGKIKSEPVMFYGDDDIYTFVNMPNLAQDRYLPLHLYSPKQFKRTAPYIAQHPEHKGVFPEIKWFNPKNDIEKRRNGYYLSGCVHLNRKKLNTRFDVIRTSAHEKEHMYQDIISRQKSQEGLEYAKAQNEYVQPEVDYKKYRKNKLEEKSREAGRLAGKEYRESADRIQKEFPYAPNYQLGYSFKDDTPKNNSNPMMDLIKFLADSANVDLY